MKYKIAAWIGLAMFLECAFLTLYSLTRPKLNLESTIPQPKPESTENESRWQRDFDTGFESGVVCCYAVMMSGVNYTNMNDLIYLVKDYKTNALKHYRKDHP